MPLRAVVCRNLSPRDGERTVAAVVSNHISVRGAHGQVGALRPHALVECPGLQVVRVFRRESRLSELIGYASQKFEHILQVLENHVLQCLAITSHGAAPIGRHRPPQTCAGRFPYPPHARTARRGIHVLYLGHVKHGGREPRKHRRPAVVKQIAAQPVNVDEHGMPPPQAAPTPPSTSPPHRHCGASPPGEAVS